MSKWDRLRAYRLRYSLLFWKILFIVNVAVIGFGSVVSVLVYFYFPSIEVSVTLPANVWGSFLAGGLTKDLMMGALTAYSWFHGFGKHGVVIKNGNT